MPKYDEEGNLISLEDDDDDLDFYDDDPDLTAPDNDAFKHKYDVLQGKYNAETARQQEMISQLLADRAKLEASIEDMKNQRGTFTPSPQDQFNEKITKLASEFPSLAEGIDAMIEKKVSERIKVTDERIDTVQANTAKTAYDTFLDRLDSAMPEWRQINTDPGFVAWLSTQDRYTGASKMDLLKGAYTSMNVQSTLAFFEDYIATKGSAIADPSISAPSTRRTATPGKAGSKLDTFGSADSTITRADITQFYKLRALDSWPGTEEEAQKYEARIHKAVKEGKVK